MSSRKLSTAVEEAEVRDLSHEGQGICSVGGKVAFVPGALPGEIVRLRRVLRMRQYDQAELVEVVRPSPDRIEPACAHFGTCGGCSLQHMAPAAQLRQKQKWLLDSLERIGGVVPNTLLAPLDGPQFGYRRRARLGVKYVIKKERLLIGFRERNGRFLADLSSCPVLDPRVGEQLEALREMIAGLSCYRQIPQVEIAAGTDVVAYVVRHLEPLSAADEQRIVEFGAKHGVQMLVQGGGPATIRNLSTENRELAYRLEPWGVELKFAPSDFVQVNPQINEKMIGRALELLDPSPAERVLELFCGLGNFTLPIARRAASVTGVEGDAELVRKAKENALLNRIENAMFYSANLAQAPDTQLEWVRGRYEKVLLDPPRSGAAELMPFLVEKQPSKIVYVSCNPATLARDAGVLVAGGYRLSCAGVMDMFPHTAHVESIALFERGR